jgi:hypothetical protein
MINFNYENEFNLENEDAIASWLSASILSEEEINYIFVMTNIYKNQS